MTPEAKGLLARMMRAKKNFTASLTFSQKNIYPYESVGAVVTLRSKVNHPQTLLGMWSSSVSIRRNGSSAWDRFNPPGPQFSSTAIIERTIAPRETRSEFWTIGANYRNEHTFAVPGIYYLQGQFNVNATAPQRLVVKAPPASERAALRYLSRHSLYRYFAHDTAAIYLGSPKSLNASLQLRSFISRYPTSRYAHWSRLGLLFIQQQRAGENRVALSSVQKEMEWLAPQLIPAVKAVCLYEAGVIARKRGDLSAARVYFRKALATRADATIAARIGILNRMYPGPYIATDPFSQTVRQLEAQGYDIKRFMASPSQGSEEYRIRESRLFEMGLQKKITPTEYMRRRAALLRYYVTKYTKPKR